MMFKLIPSFKDLMPLALGVCLLWAGAPSSAQAGCGCTKAPPEPTAVRPHATYAGMEVAIFDASLHVGQAYDVTFDSLTGESVTVQAEAVSRRDQADGDYKLQLNVALPDLPLGPAGVRVSLAGQAVVLLSVADSALTVVPQPLELPTEVGETIVPDFQAAVGRDGTFYVSLDVSAVTMPRTFQVQALGYPFHFSHDEVIVSNVQGFIMQLLEEGMPGLYAISTPNSADSTLLQYSRHEFNTYFLQHDERQPHAVDSTDGNWHLDGTPHINHNHLIIAIAGTLSDGSLPTPGATPAFDFALKTFTLFQHGLVGDTSVQLKLLSKIASFNSHDRTFGSQGDVWSNGKVEVNSLSVVDGSVTGSDLKIKGRVTGKVKRTTQPIEFLPVDIPDGLEDLGSIVLSLKTSILGPGSYKVSHIAICGAGRLLVDNTDGPVTLYVTGEGAAKALDVSWVSGITVLSRDPEKFAVYVAQGEVAVSLGDFYGVIYAPESLIRLTALGNLFGSFVADKVEVSIGSQIYYDTALRGEGGSLSGIIPGGAGSGLLGGLLGN